MFYRFGWSLIRNRDNRDNIYKDMLRDQDLYDFSEYTTDHPNYREMNKKVLGKFKDEFNSMPLEEFIGLRPKCYSLLFHGAGEKQSETQ